MGRRKERNKLNGRRHLISEAVEEGWCHLRVDLLAISWADLKVRRSRGTVICRSIFCQPYFRAVRVVYLVEVALKLDLSPAQPGSLFFLCRHQESGLFCIWCPIYEYIWIKRKLGSAEKSVFSFIWVMAN